eukprot:CAMPEP_0116097640 /NCGR_PEP_ID=MMETSP0327-20121206/10813_1 /TAXON_ID=44447 /ORGANISM="Pseudo-nitzschia delicatissima, Strain B596" /LENGTH=319 /DNA_ID=CAMNT_0003589405 /DNA_START=156 /DNA_END=1111 /DNA_ORIENTATION=+
MNEIHPLAKDPQNPLVELRHCLSLKREHEGPDTEDMVADDYHRGTGGKSQLPVWSSDPRFQFQNVTLEQVAWQNSIHKLKLPSLSKAQAAGYNHAWFWQSPIVDCPNMLESFLDELSNGDQGDADVDVETGVYYQSQEELFEEAKKLDCDTIVNCTGMGALELCGDSSMTPARGALLRYDRASCKRLEHSKDEPLSAGNEQLQDACIFADEAPWAGPDLPCYMIIRGNDVVIGGTCLMGDKETEMRPEERKRLLETARLFGIDTDACQPKEEWVGFRPYRQEEIRCEIDEATNDGIRLVHCYGTGGSGWTIYTGLSREA